MLRIQFHIKFSGSDLVTDLGLEFFQQYAFLTVRKLAVKLIVSVLVSAGNPISKA